MCRWRFAFANHFRRAAGSYRALLALRLPRGNRRRNFAALILPIGLGLAFHLILNYAKFGIFSGASYDYYINSVHREFAHEHGIFNLSRVPYSFADYFNLSFPSFQVRPPFLRVDRHLLSHPTLYSLPFSETYLSLPWCSGWLVLGAIMGIVCLFRRNQSDYFQRWIAAALFAQFVCVLSDFALAQRYTADLVPFLISCLLVFLSAGGILLLRLRYLLIGLVVVSIAVNSLATAFWLGSDPNLPVETRVFWSVIAGKKPIRVK